MPVLKRLLSSRGLVVGVVIVLVFLGAAYFAPLPFDPLEVSTQGTLLEPSGVHWFGTDQNGGDVFSRIIAGGRTDLSIAIVSALLSAVIGVPIGLLVSASGRGSAATMRGLDIFQSFPLVILSLVVIAFTGSSVGLIILSIVLVNVPQFIRLVRSSASVVRTSRFVEAAVAIGGSPSRVTFRHVLPNVTPIIFAQLSLSAANAVLTLAALSYIGVGVKPPTPSWGSMIRGGVPNVITGEWWIALFPAIAILIFVASFSVIADGLQKAVRRI